jgi:LAO/AO transport system kinase
VLSCSALEGLGLEAIWEAVLAHHEALKLAGALTAKRAAQARAWLWSEITEGLLRALRESPLIATLAKQSEAEVSAGAISPSAAARRLLAAFLGDRPPGGGTKTSRRRPAT